jgi:sporulation protein YlmC with PRC-barrel domain
MTKALLKISAIGAACAMLSASAWAQSESQGNSMNDQSKPATSSPSTQNNNNRSWSTKHLSATGRMNDTAVRASKLMGAQVDDSSGQPVGQVRDIIVNPASGRIDFALLSVNTANNNNNNTENNMANNNSNNGKLIPVPWALLRTPVGSSQYSTSTSASAMQPTFTLNADQSKLNGAPTVNWSDLSQSEWRQRIYSYYGVTPQSAMGGAESPSGEIKGEGAREMEQGTTPNNQQPPAQQPQQQQNQ